METSESAATRSVAATVCGAAAARRVRRIRTAQATAQVARGGTAPRATRAQGVYAGRGSGRGYADACWSVGRRAVAVVLGGCCGRGRVHRHAVPGCGQRRTLELSHHGRGHRAKRVVRTRVPHVTVRGPPDSARIVHTILFQSVRVPIQQRRDTHGGGRDGVSRTLCPPVAVNVYRVVVVRTN